MQIKQIAADAAAELTDCLSRLDEAELEALEAKVKSAHRVFVAGTGRSLLMIRGFAMRLMHAGLDVSVVGETTTPAIEPDDLLVIASGSGSTSTLVAIARRCKDAGAPLALITTRPDSPIGNLADGIVTIPAVSGKVEGAASISVQPGSNTFEQAVLLVGDAVAADIIAAGGLAEGNEELMRRHANLE